jgi:hypothetical protein
LRNKRAASAAQGAADGIGRKSVPILESKKQGALRTL